MQQKGNSKIMEQENSNKSKILIVDDSMNNLKLLSSTLKHNGYAIYIAQNGMNALNILEKVSPDLILLDVVMPEMDGYEVCKKIKDNENDTIKNIPIIFLTAKVDKNDIIKGFQCGAVDYITKPFHPMELLARVKTHISLKQSKDMIEKISQERKELIHILCHDIKNPLGAIQSFSELILNDISPVSHLKYISSSVTSILEIVDLVRDIQKVEDKSISLEHVNLKHSIQTSIESLTYQFDKKNITPILDIPDMIYVWAEPVSMIHSVFNNLFTNAIKFSYPNNSIKVSYKIESESFVKLSIKDFGIGIPEILQKNIFSINKNTTRVGTNGEKGTGFGMPLVKKFMIAYGGDILLLSQDENAFPQEHGTEFILTFVKAVTA